MKDQHLDDNRLMMVANFCMHINRNQKQQCTSESERMKILAVIWQCFKRRQPEGHTSNH